MNNHIQPCGCGACVAVMQSAAQANAQACQAQAAGPTAPTKPKPRSPAEGYLQDLQLASVLAQKAAIWAAKDRELRDRCKTAREAIDEACALLATRLER